jgi:cytochrome P450
MYPPAYGFARTVIEPFALGGVDFTEKTVVIISTYAMHHRPDLYPEPDLFRPERFLDEEPQRFAYLPFGAGPRICLGKLFSLLEAGVILATMIQHVRLAPQHTEEAILDTLVTLRPRDAIEMRVTERR